MHKKDMQIISGMWPRWKKYTGDVNSICLLSPCDFEAGFLLHLFPDAKIVMMPVTHWDLNSKNDQTFDIVVASGIFMYSKDPDLWFDNVFSSSRFLWMNDHILAWRGADKELADESMRYQFLPDHPARIADAYDLNRVKDKIVEMKIYPYTKDEGNGSDKEAKTFVALLDRDLHGEGLVQT